MVDAEWVNVLLYFCKDELQDLHESLFGNKGGAKSKQELVDAVLAHSLGIEILKKQSVKVDKLRDVLVQKAGMAPKEAKALSKQDIVEKLRQGELRVPKPGAATDAAAAPAPKKQKMKAQDRPRPISTQCPTATGPKSYTPEPLKLPQKTQKSEVAGFIPLRC
jgi:hypothetical protein